MVLGEEWLTPRRRRRLATHSIKKGICSQRRWSQLQRSVGIWMDKNDGVIMPSIVSDRYTDMLWVRFWENAQLGQLSLKNIEVRTRRHIPKQDMESDSIDQK